VARCINREVREGRGSPHGGVFLDIAWIKEKLGGAAKAEEHIKKKLPSMYHQFITLAGVDITKEPMEVGPTTHYVMGGVKVDGDTQMSTVPGLFAAGEVAAGLHGANRLGGNSLSDLIVFGKRAGEYAAKFAKENTTKKLPEDQIQNAARNALAPIERQDSGGENPYEIMYALQDAMQAHAGIVRDEKNLQTALHKVRDLMKRARNVRAPGSREYNPGWHTALDLANLLTVSEALALSGIDRKESRGGHFREDHPKKDDANFGNHNTIIRRKPNGEMELHRQPIKPMPEALKKVVEANK
jgi:succinate dehydrogenase / fumarate reductase flavoprotein subunit